MREGMPQGVGENGSERIGDAFVGVRGGALMSFERGAGWHTGRR